MNVMQLEVIPPLFISYQKEKMVTTLASIVRSTLNIGHKVLCVVLKNVHNLCYFCYGYFCEI